jgi:hypothetical protein
MSEVRLLDIGEIEQEVFGRWDITGQLDNEAYAAKGETIPSLGRRQGSRPCR